MRWLRTLAAVVLVLLIAEVGARTIESRIPPAETWSSPFVQAKADRLEELSSDGGATILFGGSSITNANLDAGAIGELLGVRAYNIGLPSSSVPIWEAFLDDVALERACPSLVVIGIGIRDMNANLPGLTSGLNRYRNAAGRKVAIGEGSLAENADDWLRSVSAFVRIRPRLREPASLMDWLRTGQADGWVNTNLDPYGRYLGFADDPFRTEAQLATLADGAFRDYDIGGPQQQALRSIIDAAHAAGHTIAIVDVPALDTLLATAIPGGIETVNLYHRRLFQIARNTDTPLLFPQEMVDDESYFADLYHYNQHGADTLTPIVTEWLNTLEWDRSGGC